MLRIGGETNAAPDRPRVRAAPMVVPNRLHVFVVALAAVLAHGLCLRADFYMDDLPLIFKSEYVREGNLGIFQWRWIPYSIFIALYHLVGPSTLAFHLVNLTLHVAISVIVFAAGRDSLGRLGLIHSETGRTVAAFAGALIFATHPLGSEAVNYARCAMIQFVTLFSVIAAWSAVRFFDAPNRRWGMVLAVSVLCAACSKGPGLFHALANVGLVCVAMQGYRKMDPAVKMKLAGKRWILALPLFLLVLYLSYTWSREVRAVFLRWDNVFVPHTVTQGRIFWGYAARIVFPIHLCSDHYVPWSGGFKDLGGVMATASLLLLSGVAACGLFIRKFRPVSLLVCLILAPFLLRFLYPVKELMVEYRAYPALPWVGLLAGVAIWAIYRAHRTAGMAVGTAIVGIFIVASAARSQVWHSAATLAQSSHEQYPLNGRALTQLQGAAFRAGNFADVVELRDIVEDVTRQNEQFNIEQEGKRAYEIHRAHENYCNSEQLVVMALAEWKGDKAGLEYADRRLADLAKRYPQFYLDPKTGGFHPENTLVRARAFLLNRLELARIEKTGRG